jgi:transcription initiation factor TFIID subunit TAF12
MTKTMAMAMAFDGDTIAATERSSSGECGVVAMSCFTNSTGAITVMATTTEQQQLEQLEQQLKQQQLEQQLKQQQLEQLFTESTPRMVVLSLPRRAS